MRGLHLKESSNMYTKKAGVVATQLAATSRSICVRQYYSGNYNRDVQVYDLEN